MLSKGNEGTYIDEAAITVEGIRFKISDNTLVTIMIPNETPRARTGKVKVDELKEGLAEYYDGDET